MPRLLPFWRNLLRRERVERELDDELAAVLQVLVDEKTRAGMTGDDALRAARLELGSVNAIKDNVRDARAGVLVETLVQDVRFGTRLLIRNPIFTLTAALSLAIGIGATTTIFTVANGLLLRAATGVEESDRLVDISPTGDGLYTEPVVPITYYRDVRRAVTTFEDLYASQLDVTPMSLRVDGSAERVFAGAVTPNYFVVLRVPATAGRVFQESDAAAASTVVLSHRFWTRRFNADVAIVGTTAVLNGRPVTVIGVAAEGFRGTGVLAPDLWVPLAVDASPERAVRVTMGGRLRSDVSMAQASQEIDVIGRALDRGGRTITSVPGGVRRDTAAAGVSRLRLDASSPVPANLRVIVGGFLALLMGLVLLVLVIACTNLAGVLLARATTRRREISVRLTMGAGRARVVRQLITETMLLFLLGGLAGLMLARALTTALVSLLPAFPLPVDVSLPLDFRVVAFAFTISLVSALLCGLAPALTASNANLASALKDEAAGTPARLRLRNAFVVVQVAFSVVLVIAAAVLLQALARVRLAERGFATDRIQIASLDLSMASYSSSTGARFVRELLGRIRALPGVEAATVADRTSIPVVRLNGAFTVPGLATPGEGSAFAASWNIVEPEYFETLRIPLVEGRDFTASDMSGTESVAIVAEATARRLWPDGGAIGQQVVTQGIGGLRALDGSTEPEARNVTVVGVARDVVYDGAAGAGVPFVLYVPMQQHYSPRITILARAAGHTSIAADLRAAVAATDPNLPILSARSLDDEITGPELVQLRVAATVAGSVGLVALMLAAIGVYGVTAFSIAQRTREHGVRLALGAQRADVLRLVLWEGMRPVAIGALVGVALAAAGIRIASGTSLQISQMDPATGAGAVLIFVAVGLTACYLPIRRISADSVMTALRYE